MFGGCEGLRCLKVATNIDVQEFLALARPILFGGDVGGGRRVSSL